MLLRLGSHQFIGRWQKLLNYKTLELPKIYNNFVNSSSSSFTTTCFNYSRITHQQNEKQQLLQSDVKTRETNVVKSAFEKFRSSPYVRIMRLDRPIGN